MSPPQQSVIMPSFDDIMEEVEHLVSIRSSLLISKTNQDNVIAVGQIIFEKIFILKKLDGRALFKCNLDKLERIVSLHSTLRSDKTRYTSKGREDYAQSFGEVHDCLIKTRLQFFDELNPFGAFATGLNIVRRLAKVAEAWTGYYMESALSKTLKRLESISENKIIYHDDVSGTEEPSVDESDENSVASDDASTSPESQTKDFHTEDPSTGGGNDRSNDEAFMPWSQLA